jgi:hypothetical protein
MWQDLPGRAGQHLEFAADISRPAKMSAAVSAGRRVYASEKSYDRSDFNWRCRARHASLVAGVGIMIGTGEYTMGIGLTALVLLV